MKALLAEVDRLKIQFPDPRLRKCKRRWTTAEGCFPLSSTMSAQDALISPRAERGAMRTIPTASRLS